MKALFLVFAVVAVVAIGQSATIAQSTNTVGNFTDEPASAHEDQNDAGFGTADDSDGDEDFLDDDDDDDIDGEDSIDPDTQLDGIPLKLLSKEEIGELLDEDDKILESQLDILAAAKQVKARQATDTIAQDSRRRKRWVPLALGLFRAGRMLFSAARMYKVTTSAARLTRHYRRSGTYHSALRDFARFKPSNVKSFTSGSIRGHTGTVGKHRFTVRNGSSSGRPTLEIRSPGNKVRKFRYKNE